MIKYLIPLLLLCSCNKLEELTLEPSINHKSQVHIQSINATVMLTINGVDTMLYNNNKHIVQSFEVENLKTVSIFKVYGEKVTASIKHQGASYDIGEITYFKSYKC